MSLFQGSVGALSQHFKALLHATPNEELVEKDQIFIRELPPLLKNGVHLTKIDLRLVVDTEFSLDTFGDLPALKSLTLLVERARAARVNQHGILPPKRSPFRSLTALTIQNTNLFGEFSEALSRLKLEELSLEGCRFIKICRLHVLEACKTLRRFNTKNLHTEPLIHGSLLELSKRAPKLEITSQTHIKDYRDFADLFSSEKYLPNLSLDEIFSLAATEELHWERDPDHPSSYVHNVAPLRGSSFIDLGDERVRIAACEPFAEHEKAAFWQFVDKENVTLIVKVKTDDSPPYFPYSDDAVKVASYSMIYDGKINRTRRELDVNGRIVHFLQLEWPPFEGMDIKKLLPFIKELAALENELGGKTIIHCTAGVGRTGTAFACLLTWLKAQALQRDEKPLYFNPAIAILGLRQMRPSMIERVAQLETVAAFADTLFT